MFGQTIGHRISAIVSAMSILAGCLTIAVSYYFIHKRAASDEYATDSGTKNPTAVATGVADYNATSKKTSESLGKFTENDAYMKQLQLTLKLVFLTVYFWSTWFTALASFVYQMISKQNVSPELDFALTMVANSASVINPLLVLSMDSRWRIKFPLQMCRKRKTEISEY
ncbi:hypothetical protein BKA69DRAFT_1102964 [Paraphysoderma sedebokerense]|nr:hypothetical protein BKA69DRAFT_1102964 [Paraphysoderma sedebokerense]